MSKKVLITSDSTTDLSPMLIDRYQVKILPLSVTLDGKTYTDGIDIVPDDIYAVYEEKGILPKTAAPNLGQTMDFFKKYTEEGYAIVHFTLSSLMSSSYQNAFIAAKDFEDVYVVDTKNLSTGGGLLVCKAGDLATEGKSAAEIAEICTALTPKVDASFVIDNLEYLYKGGRCSAVAAFAAGVLSLKPCIVVRDGAMDVGKKYRGKFEKVVKKYIGEQVGDASDIDKTRIFLTHAGLDDDIVREWADYVKTLGDFEEVLVTRAGRTISSHCGRSCIGVLFIRN